MFAVALACAGVCVLELGCGSHNPAGTPSGATGGAGAAALGAGCLGAGTPACGPGLVCQRSGAGACVDPSWAEWPMPNAEVEVEAGAPNLQTYHDNADGTATDVVTGLMWQQLAPPGSFTQPQAAAYCDALGVGGYQDWRLPQVIELVSIVDTGTYDPSIDSTVFPGTSAEGFYWSSTPYVGLPDNMWGVYFNNGYAAYNPSFWAKSVRCVR